MTVSGSVVSIKTTLSIGISARSLKGSIMTHRLNKQTKHVRKDVLVVGGGTAGFVAAIAAARNGANVLVLEQRDHLGGTHSGGMVMMIRSMRHMRAPNGMDQKRLMMTRYESSFDDEQIVRSIAQEYIDRMLDIGSAWGQKGQAATRQLFDPEIAKWVIQDMVQEAGAEIWLNSNVTEILAADGSVHGVALENLRERVEIHAPVIIDATGDADICAAAGADYEVGSPDDGRCQPMSLYFIMAGVDLDKTLAYAQECAAAGEFTQEYADTLLTLKREQKPLTMFPFKGKIKEALQNGEYPLPYNLETVNPDTLSYIVRPMFRGGRFRYDVTSHNMDMAYNVDGTNRIELTKATLAMRDLANRMAVFYRKYIPGYENSYLSHTAQSVGVRDTRRIVCDYTITQEDVLAGRSFEDGIGRYGSLMDVHDKSGKKALALTEVGGKGWFHIPFRAMLPKGVKNVIVAGRSISADYNAQGSVRSQAACMVTGQAAGTAAALAVRGNIEPREIDVAKLQTVLKSQDQVI
jgi:ribulose 1,5-bisphosphate synthetase/thiazole synthase